MPSSIASQPVITTRQATSSAKDSEKPVVDLPEIFEKAGLANTRKSSHKTIGTITLLAFFIATVAIYYLCPALQEIAFPSQPQNASVLEPAPRLLVLGRLEPAGELVDVSGPENSSGTRIQEVLIEEGEWVSAGQKLAVLDSYQRLLAEKESAWAQVRQVEAELEQMLIIVKTNLEDLQAQLGASQTQLEMEKVLWRRRQDLYQSQIITEEELDEARNRYQKAQYKVDGIQSRLERYRGHSSREPVDVQVARTVLHTTEMNLRQAEVRLENAFVTAPVSGQIVKQLLRPGELVNHQPVLQMGRTDQMFARLEIYETDRQNIETGMAVVMNSPALRQQLSGKITFISQVVEQQQVIDAIPAANTDARVIEILVQLDASSSMIAAGFIGLQVEAEIL